MSRWSRLANVFRGDPTLVSIFVRTGFVGAFQVDPVMRLVERERVTNWGAVPTMASRLSGLKARLYRMPFWRHGGPTGWPVAASHKRAVLSTLPVKTCRPFGLKAKGNR